jgi:lipid-A-disaccharide synthase
VLQAWRAAIRHLRGERPDLVLLVDYPDFNLRFARQARRAGIPVVYFVGPQVWAWRRHRVRQIARDVTRMLVILPFEEEFYREHGVPARFVGHPLADLTRPAESRAAAAQDLGLPVEAPVLGLLPGSRRNEVKALLPVMLQAAERLRRSHPGLRCLLPVASRRHREMVSVHLASSPVPLEVVEGRFEKVVSACSAALVASGTATLETALLEVPMVVAYSVRPSTFRLVRWLSPLEHAALPNLILGRRVVPECIQTDCTPENLAAEISPFLKEGERRREMIDALRQVRVALGGGGSIERAADEIVDLLRTRIEGSPQVP